jgi:peptide/nickel transport system substrate-binding protein
MTLSLYTTPKNARFTRLILSLSCILLTSVFFSLSVSRAPAEGSGQHAIAMYGEPALPPDFFALPYVNPHAPQGGRLVLGALGSFDSLNPYGIVGVAGQGTDEFLYQSLMFRSRNEPFTLYGLVAQSIEIPEDRSFVTFHLNPQAQFSDGHPLHAEDVLFSWELLKEKGQPYQRNYLSKVRGAHVHDPLTITFDLSHANNRELPLILGLMPILPRHAVSPETFEKPSRKIPVGSGPYVLAEVDLGRSLIYKKNPHFWAKDLPIMRGMYNFSEIRIDYYRDVNSLFSGFRAGLYDFRIETSATRWATDYNFPAREENKVRQENVRTFIPKPPSGFVFNTRHLIFKDIRIREAFQYFFDFPWVNKHLFYDLYHRSTSYFSQSELASTGHPASPEERKLLEPFLDEVRPDILEGTWLPPESDGSGRDRIMIAKGVNLLKEAGFLLQNGQMVQASNGQPLAFEILVSSRDQQRLALQFSMMLKMVGITATVRLLDEAQYWQRLKKFNFDMIWYTWNASATPGNEQENRWGSAAADRMGSLNYAGVRSQGVDSLIKDIISATTWANYVASVRAFDRLLLSGFYMIPLFYAPNQWVAYRCTLNHPEKISLFGTIVNTWWWDPSCQENIKKAIFHKADQEGL